MTQRNAGESQWDRPGVTVIVNNYNYAGYVGEAIQSALDQTHANVQVVVVDDGSTDGSAEVISSFGPQIEPVLQRNGGQGSAFNSGFRAARCSVVIFLDADDRLRPEAASTVASVFAEDPSTALVQYRLAVIDDRGRPTGEIRPRRTGVLPSGHLGDHVVKYRAYHWQPTSGNAYSAAALAKVLPMPEEGYRIEADAFLGELIPFCGRISGLDAVLGEYRVHGANNHHGTVADAAFYRKKIMRIESGHALLRERAVSLGRVDVPASSDAALDAAFMGFRLASLRLDPDHHPVPGESRWRLGWRGAVASATNRQFPIRGRVVRTAWFVGASLAPDGLARRLIRRFTPDGPRRSST